MKKFAIVCLALASMFVFAGGADACFKKKRAQGTEYSRKATKVIIDGKEVDVRGTFVKKPKNKKTRYADRGDGRGGGHRPGGWGGHHRPGGWGGGGWGRGPGWGEIAGGIVIGNAINNWLNPPVVVEREVEVVEREDIPEAFLKPGSPDWYKYCTNRYKSFDPESGTYLGLDGFRHACQA